ncbi:MAG: hypothetical protein QY323_03335 [Patescibacteria group bacterium]|nr:MAG: hypothetical protein QY323_03335 [Patescibacteria group bacterium]
MLFFALLAAALLVLFVSAFIILAAVVMLIALAVVLQHVFAKRDALEVRPPARAPLPKARTVYRPPRSASR